MLLTRHLITQLVLIFKQNYKIRKKGKNYGHAQKFNKTFQKASVLIQLTYPFNQ